ncbi:MAG: sodium:calcium antiporter [Chloroflexi bacterium]|nr:sodium:calcium antiporter [Chloroflexota bacterium]
MKSWLWVVTAIAATIPAFFIRLSGVHLSPPAETVTFGMAIVGAAFLLTWGAEVAELEVSQALALAFLALIAVLPEYAVDIYFAWTAAKDPQYAAYAAANMTGSNRLLIGIGWSMVAIMAWAKFKARSVTLASPQRVELSFLALATIYAFLIPIKGNSSLIDTAILFSLFGVYMWASSRMGLSEPELVGPAATIGCLPRATRRGVTLFLFALPAVVILLSAAPFADGLVQTGRLLEIDEFLLVQWLAPLASEAPELLVAAIFTLRNNAAMAIGALLSSKLNQWTLLVGSLPLAYTVSLGGVASLPLDARQVEEVLLTAAQSAFALVLLGRMSLSRRGALVLLALFSTQLVLVNPVVRYGYSAVYLAAALVLLLADRDRRRGLFSLLRQPFGH